MTTSKDPQSAWGKYVLRVLEEHKTNPRQQRARTGLAHTTIYSWLDDIPPKADGVIQFARGFGRNLNEALDAAGMEPVEDDSPTFREGLVRLLRTHSPELTYEPEVADIDVSGWQGAENLSRGDIEIVNEVLRALEVEAQQGRGVDVERNPESVKGASGTVAPFGKGGS